MRLEDFSDTGRTFLVQVSGGWAFVPPLVPPDIPLSRQLLAQSERARGVVSELVGEARRTPNITMVLRPLVVLEAVRSSRIEGIHTEVRDVLLERAAPHAAEDGERQTVSDAELRDIREVFNNEEAITLGHAWLAEGRTLTLSVVKELHAALLRNNVRGQDKHPGAFRKTQVWIGNRGDDLASSRYVPPPPEQVEPLLDNLIAFMHQDTTYGPLIDCAISHYQFEAIHPFEDGNGRIGRVLIPLHLMLQHVIDQPLLSLGLVLDSEREEYLHRLNQVSVAGDWDGWVMFFLDMVRQQALVSLKRVERTLELYQRYRDLTASLSSRVPHRVIEFLMEQPFVSAPQVARFAGTSYPTARAAVDSLVELGILNPLRRISGTQYWEAAELIASIYEG